MTDDDFLTSDLGNAFYINSEIFFSEDYSQVIFLPNLYQKESINVSYLYEEKKLPEKRTRQIKYKSKSKSKSKSKRNSIKLNLSV